MTKTNSKISIKTLSKDFQHGAQAIAVLKEISFEVYPNEFFCILGPSGCGKSTLLNIISGLIKPSSGEVFVDGKLSDDSSRSLMGYVFQEPRLLPWRTVLENVAFGLEAKRMHKVDTRNKVIEQISLVGLSEFAQSYPHQLSGGMKHRVALARVFSIDPEIILMDEPFSSLDFQTRTVLQRELLSIWERKKRTIIFVTHDPYEAVYLADRVLILSNRPTTVKSVKAVKLQRPRRWQDPKTLSVYYEVLDRIGIAE